MQLKEHKFWVVAGAVAILTSVSGCAVTPEPLTDEDRAARIQEDMQAMFADQEAVSGAISIEEAMARAIKYNLDHRVKLMEQAQSEAELKVATRDFLPRIAASAGYTNRSNEAGARSISLLTGQESLEQSTSQQRDRSLADVTLAWNILDFGVSYVTAKQTADGILIAEERRRRSIQNIMQDVRVAYWRAVSAQRLTNATDRLLEDTKRALERSRQARREGVQTPEIAMEFQRDLLETLRTLIQLRQELSVSKTELASLMNLKPGTNYELVVVADPEIPDVSMSVEQMEDMALNQRPELREEDYRRRVSRREVRKSLLRMLPGIEIAAGYHYDSNRFLFNNDWFDGTVSVTWNLFNLFSGPAVKRRAEAQVEVDNARRLALSMAVMTQVQVALQRYAVARQDYALTRDLAEVNSSLSEQVQARRQANAADSLAVIRGRTKALVAEMARDQAYAELQNAVGRIENTVGMDPLPETVAAADIQSLAEAIAAHDAEMGMALVQPSPDEVRYGQSRSHLFMLRPYRVNEFYVPYASGRGLEGEAASVGWPGMDTLAGDDLSPL